MKLLSHLTSLPRTIRNGVVAATLVLGLAVAATPADAATISFNASVSSTLTDWSQGLVLSKFDPSLGTLTSIDLVFTSTANTSILLTNTSGAASSGTVSTRVRLSLTDALNLISSPTTKIDMFLPDIDGASYSLASGDSTTVGPFSGTGTPFVANYTASGILSEFTGLGNITLTGSTITGTLLDNTGGNTAADQTTQASAAVTIVYNYTAVPEPSTVALLVVAGSGAVIGMVRRKKLS